MLVGLNHAHNATGSVYALACIFALAFALRSKKKYKIYYAVILVICLAGLFMTQSRGSYVGFVAGALIVIWYHFRSILKFSLITIGFTVLSIPFFIVFRLHERFLIIFNAEYWSVGRRIDLWTKAVYLFKQSPIFGVGFGRFNDIDYNIDQYALIQLDEFAGFPGIINIHNAASYDFNTAHAHNSYLHFLAETGILGIGLIILFWILCYRIILKGYNSTSNNFYKTTYLSSLGSIIILFTMSFTENYFSATTMIMCLSMVVSLALGLLWQENKKDVFR
jgi:O-antigen ligase